MDDKAIYSYSLEDERIELRPCTLEILEAAIESDAVLEELTGYGVRKGWNAFGTEPFQYVLPKLKEDPALLGWYTYLILHKEQALIIGTCGYKGRPDRDGLVELGYEVGSAYRDKGFATRACGLLVREALQRAGVETVIAHTLPEVNSSVSVLRKCGFEYKGEIRLPDDGKVWRWKTDADMQTGLSNR